MAAPQRQFELVPDETDAPAPEKPGIAFDVLMLSLQALSQRTIVALSNLFSLITVCTVFWLALSIIPRPDVYQLVGLGLYGAFVIALNVIVRRK